MAQNKKKGPKSRSGEQASGVADVGEAEGIVLSVMEALTDERILSLLKKALYTQPLDDKIERIRDGPISYSVVSRKRARVRTLMRKFCLS